ncbi:hypothetical protein AAE478_009730 [Parahypoxylon ruwenzoriense]
MAPFQVGFYTITLLTVLKVIIIALEVFLHWLAHLRGFLQNFFENHALPRKYYEYLASLLKPMKFLNSILRQFEDIEDPTSLLRWSGYVSAFLALILGCVSFVGLGSKGPDEPGQCESADADIVGDGVRAAAWMQVGILFLITFTGVWHFRETAVKEIGGGLIITHVSLAIALLVPLARKELSPIDAILGSLILDAQGSSLSIQLVTKETLAARWQVGITLLAQLLGLIIEGILVGSFTTDLLPSRACNCFSVFWWAWFSNCPTDSPPNDIRPYWIYFGYRFINIAHGSYFAITRAETFHEAERWDLQNPCNPSDVRNCRTCDKCSYCKTCKRRTKCHEPRSNSPGHNEPHQDSQSCPNCSGCTRCGYAFGGIKSTSSKNCESCNICTECGHNIDASNSILLFDSRFSESMVTVSITFLENSVLALLSMISAEVTMSVNLVQKTSPLYSVGQVTALTIAGGTALRALWYFLFMFYKRPPT